MARSNLPLILALVLAGCATPEGQREPAPFAYSRGVVSTAELPAGHAVTDGNAPLYVRVGEGDAASLEQVDEANANVVVRFTSRDHDSTRVSLQAKTARMLKMDLYISPDGEHWQYTSSCPFGATYELWPQDVRFLALAQPRWLDASDHVCR